MKKYISVLVCAIFLVLSGCCPTQKASYVFRQGLDQIERIEIAIKEKYDPALAEEPVVLKILDKQEHQAVVEELMKADGNIILSPPGRGIGVYIVQIIYKDGEIEMIGEYNNGYITPEGIVCQGNYCINNAQFYEIVSRFLGVTVEQPTLG